jgi:hypothetical protein
MKPFTVIAAAFAALIPMQAYAEPVTTITFPLTVSAGAKNCLHKAEGTVTVHTLGVVENLDAVIEGLPPNTDFVIFNIQVPNKPFGLAWYNGDILTDAKGVGATHLVGRFNIGTFILSPGAVPSPQVFPDNSKTGMTVAPVQIYHIGIWFNSPHDAAKAGCSSTVTPFTSNHQAGIQVLNTATFPDNAGPLLQLK